MKALFELRLNDQVVRAASQQKQLETSLNNQMWQMKEEMLSLKSATAKDQVETLWQHRMEKKRLSDGIKEKNQIISGLKGEQKVILANHCSMTDGLLDEYYGAKREASSSKREATDHAIISEKCPHS